MHDLMRRLERWPEVSGTKALRRDRAGHHSMRTGKYRLQFRIEAGEVIVERIGPRDGFYDEE
ncbi:MAG: hypothetical protein K1X74_09225 [Pirellulales bacterium]|nr:hypothetical protein [Pirellulales bacterium]